MVKCLLTTFMDPLFKGTQNTPLLKAEFALANAPLQSFGEMNSQCWYFANGHSVYLADSLCSWPYLKRAPLWRCGDENFFISVVRKSPPKPQCIHVSVFEFEGKCVILRLPFHISEDLMEFSEGYEGKFWCSYYNIWISIADFAILVYLSTFIYWIYSDSETLDDTTYFLFMHLTKTFLLFFFFQIDTAFKITFDQFMYSLGIEPMTLMMQHNSLFIWMVMYQKENCWLKLSIINEPFEINCWEIFPFIQLDYFSLKYPVTICGTWVQKNIIFIINESLVMWQ